MEAYRAMCAEAERDFEGFWAGHARSELQWQKPFTQVLDDSESRPSSSGSTTAS